MGGLKVDAISFLDNEIIVRTTSDIFFLKNISSFCFHFIFAFRIYLYRFLILLTFFFIFLFSCFFYIFLFVLTSKIHNICKNSRKNNFNGFLSCILFRRFSWIRFIMAHSHFFLALFLKINNRTFIFIFRDILIFIC